MSDDFDRQYAATKQEDDELWEKVLQCLRDQGEDVEALLKRASDMMAWHDSPVRASGKVYPDEV
jgi:hypothetical protein